MTHQVDPGAGALGHELGDHVGQGAAAGLAEGGGEPFPPVQQDEDVRQPVLRRGGGTSPFLVLSISACTAWPAPGMSTAGFFIRGLI
jgi:hypothetical protein